MDLSWILDNNVSVYSPTLAMVFATLAVAVAYFYFFKNSGLPPGPTGVPFLGYWPFIDHKKLHLQFEKLKKKYGDVFSFTCTGKLCISLGTSKAVREALLAQSDCFSKRREVFNYMNDIFEGGVFVTNGEDWETNKKFFLQTVKERISLSVKDLLSGSIYDSLNSTVDELREKAGQTLNIVDLLVVKCNANMRLMLFGESGISEERIGEISRLYVAVISFFSPPNLLPTGNIARYLIFPLTPGYKEAKANNRKIQKILYQIIDEHKATFNEDHMRDIIDDYIRERIVRTRKGDPTAQYFTDKCLMSTLIQIIGDGVFSLAGFIAALINIVLEHPEEVEKIYKELMEVVGADRQPTLEDKSKLTYTNAFIQEAVRTSADVFPLFPTLECTQETTLRGYRIPKGSVLVFNVYNVQNDPEIYEEPQKFNPSRFLVTEKKRKAEPVYAFGVGKRVCIGETLVTTQIFLFMTTLIKNFHILTPEGEKNDNTEAAKEGIMWIAFKPRN